MLNLDPRHRAADQREYCQRKSNRPVPRTGARADQPLSSRVSGVEYNNQE